MAINIGIIGVGVVGNAVYQFYKNKYDTYRYDIQKNYDVFDDVAKCDFIFVCVWTPQGKVDSVLDVFSKLSESGSKGIVILKSTVPPGTTSKLSKKFKNLKIVFSPEFLTERSAVQDFENPDRIVIGYKDSDTLIKVMNFFKKDFTCPLIVTDYTTAELIKLAHNNFYALKVIFSNYIYELARAIGANYDDVRRSFYCDKRLSSSHFDVWHDGYRGFSGKCLPKDLDTLLEVMRDNGIDYELFKIIKDKNKLLLSGKDLRIR